MTTRPAPAFERADETAGVHAARERFFQAVHRVEPRVSGDLMGQPLTLYRPIYQDYQERTASHRGGLCPGWAFAMQSGWLPGWTHFLYATDAHDPPSHGELRDVLQKWSRRWRLLDPWCLESAVETLARMSADDEDPAPEPLHYLGTRMIEMPFGEEEIVFSFQSKGWYPTLESWDWAAERIRDKFNRELRAYRERVERLARDEGFVPTKRERTRAGDHLEWLARYVVGWETYDEIAAAVGVTRQAVADAVQAKAVAIDLEIPERRTPLRS